MFQFKIVTDIWARNDADGKIIEQSMSQYKNIALLIQVSSFPDWKQIKLQGGYPIQRQSDDNSEIKFNNNINRGIRYT